MSSRQTRARVNASKENMETEDKEEEEGDVDVSEPTEEDEDEDDASEPSEDDEEAEDSDFMKEIVMKKRYKLMRKAQETRKLNLKKYLKRISKISMESQKALAPKPKDLIHSLDLLNRGQYPSDRIRVAAEVCILSDLKEFSMYKLASPFDRRVTAIAWHPDHKATFAAASKNGDIVLWNIEKGEHDDFIHGMGPGGSIQAMKFSDRNTKQIYTASIDGTVSVKDFEGHANSTIHETPNFMVHWFTALDKSQLHNVLLAGDNQGFLYQFPLDLLTSNDHGKIKLHSSKITHVELSPRTPWEFVTASVDATVKVWDIRKMDPKIPLHTLQHDKPVNSAYFSHQRGDRLLTTDQHSQIRIYKGNSYVQERIILHPHRQFQHLTPIKASWHPLADLVIVGRYPDPNFPGFIQGERRSVDVFRAETGERSAAVVDPGVSGILSLNYFNSNGEALVSGMGQHLVIWKNVGKHEVVKEKLAKFRSRMGGGGSGRGGGGGGGGRRKRGKKGDEEDEDDDPVSKKKGKSGAKKGKRTPAKRSMEGNQRHEYVKEYYGKDIQCQSDMKLSVCTADKASKVPPHVKKCLGNVHDDILATYYGCGTPFPEGLEGSKILDLGCGSGRDSFVLSQLVGEQGMIVGVDMTPEQSGGELFFSDMYASLRVPEELKRDKVLWGEGLGGALWWEDLHTICQELGFWPPLIKEVLPIHVSEEALQRLNPLHCRRTVKDLPEGLRYVSVTYRMFKPEGKRASTTMAAVYDGNLPHSPDALHFAHDLFFKTGVAKNLSSDLVSILGSSRFGRYFTFGPVVEGEPVQEIVKIDPFGLQK
ncbi:unnamed protein product [Darwinula stevensoni]|uniref:Damage-specific DNA-binding protein 2 n=1 Tax=Darwinula stevensoni TaxID=69355 RepID=A0A7R9AB47_9CRUS|nr:unnamed protein product [Darwinula stevensoni]CAG0899037.1 unnamed protein product [Darwinula stevensoni]